MLPRINRVVVGVVMTCVVFHPHASADSRVAPAALDEATFLDRFRAHAPRRRVLDDRGRLAGAGIGVAGMRPNPVLEYEREAVPGWQVRNDFVRLAIPVDVSGRRGLGVAAARGGARAERAQIRFDTRELELEAREAYLEAMRARELAAYLHRARDELGALIAALQTRVRQGDASSYDADLAAFELETIDDERAAAEGRLEVARLRLGALIGEPTRPIEASDRLVLPRPPPAPLDPERADIEAARGRARQAEAEAEAARRSWIPRLDVMLGMIASGDATGDRIGYVVGITGELPVFSLGTPAVVRARLERARWESEVIARTSEVRGEVVQARAALVRRIARAEAYTAGPARRVADLQRRAMVAYREGDRTIFEVLDVRRIARLASIHELELIYEARAAELAWQRARGTVR